MLFDNVITVMRTTTTISRVNDMRYSTALKITAVILWNLSNMAGETLHKYPNMARFARSKLIKTYIFLYFVRICFRVRIEKFTNFWTFTVHMLDQPKPRTPASVQNDQNINYIYNRNGGTPPPVLISFPDCLSFFGGHCVLPL